MIGRKSVLIIETWALKGMEDGRTGVGLPRPDSGIAIMWFAMIPRRIECRVLRGLE